MATQRTIVANKFWFWSRIMQRFKRVTTSLDLFALKSLQCRNPCGVLQNNPLIIRYFNLEDVKIVAIVAAFAVRPKIKKKTTKNVDAITPADVNGSS